MSKKMSQNFNDSYTSAVTASTENHDQSFISKTLENTNDILLINVNEFSINKSFRKGNIEKPKKQRLSNKTFFLSKAISFKEDDINTEQWFTNKIKISYTDNKSNKIIKLYINYIKMINIKPILIRF